MDEQMMKPKGHRPLSRSALLQLGQYGLNFALSALLAGAEIFGGYAPFGLCMVGCSGAGLAGFSALLGSGLGYLTFQGLESGLRYTATALLIYAISFAFWDIKLYKQPFFMPFVGAILNAATGFVYRSGAGWTASGAVFFLTEVILTAAGIYFYRLALSPWREPREGGLTLRQMVALLILGITLVLSLARLSLLGGGVSVGQTLTALVVMVVASQGGLGLGAALGLCAGMALDLAQGTPGVLTMTYGLSGLMCGVLRGRKRSACALAYLLTNATLVLWLWTSGGSTNLLYDVFAASVLFLLLPQTLLDRIATRLTRREEASQPPPQQHHIQSQLNATAGAFRALYDSLKIGLRPEVANDGDAATIFDRAANQVCRTCALRDGCWQRDYHSTFNALNNALPTLLSKGRGEAQDFPSHFASRCLHFPQLVAAINEELTALLCRRQFRAQLRESRSAVCRQYGQLSHLLATAAGSLSVQLTPLPQEEKKLRNHLADLEIQAQVWVYRDEKGRLTARIEGPDLARLDQGPAFARLSQILGCPLRMRERSTQEGSNLLVYVQSEPLMVNLGVSARNKLGESVSGDVHTWFKTQEGLLYVLLCDGMGSGPQANQESALAARLLEDFLRAGVAPGESLSILNSALALRSEAQGGFTTVDLLELDLCTGRAALFKLGAAPSYVKRGEVVSRVTGTDLPAGLTSDLTKAQPAPLLLNPGDMVVLISDGVADRQSDSWVPAALAQFTGNSPKDLARSLIESNVEAQDDKTVLVIQLAERG